MRLPEPAEFQYACNHPPTGLIDMTNDWEWTGNTASNLLINGDEGLIAPLNQVFIQYYTAWLLAAAKGSLVTRAALADDARIFFKQPLPRAIWKQIKGGRDPEFVKFIEAAFGPRGRLRVCLNNQNSRIEM